MTYPLTPRVASSTLYESAVTRLSTSQQQLASLQEQISANKSVIRASDNPLAALQAERARTRMDRIEVEQRALQSQTAALTNAESALGDTTTLLQSFRTLVVNAGNATLSDTDRATLAQDMQAIRDQILSLANQSDSNGQLLFGGVGTQGQPFVEKNGQVQYTAVAGQAATTETGLPTSLDGFVTWMNVPTGNGTFNVAPSASTTSVWSDSGSVADPSAVTGHAYSVSFKVADGVTTYSVTDNATGSAVLADQPYTAGESITFDGLTIKASGTPKDGDSLDITPSTRNSVFDVLDRAIAAVKNNSGGQLSQAVATSLTEVDNAASRISSARGFAGQLLNRADNIASNQQTRSNQLDAQRSSAEDLDTIQALSDLETQKTMYTAALQSYSKIQSLSLFDYLS